METEPDPRKTLASRHKCSACFKQYKKKEHLIEHMRASYHSVHEPKCRVCQKHCRTFESLREHLTGPLSKRNCSMIFADNGCSLCLNLFDNSSSLSEHLRTCKLPPPSSLEAPYTKLVGDSSPDPNVAIKELVANFDMMKGTSCTKLGSETSSLMEIDYRNGSEVVDGDIDLLSEIKGYTGNSVNISPPDNNNCKKGPEAVAIDCEMVGGGSDGSLDICARVCLIDEDENLIFHAFVEPQIPVTDYRYDITGITEDHLEDAISLKEVQEKISQILYNGESISKARLNGGKARLLVGHNVEHDLDCLKMTYPDHLLRDTATYRPLLKTNLVSHSLKYLTLTYLGYEIQTGVHDPFVDCISTIRLYKRMRDQDHHIEGLSIPIESQHKPNWVSNNFDARKSEEHEAMTPDELFQISSSNYRCWCLDHTDPSSILSLEEEETKVETPWPAWRTDCPLRIISF